MGIVEIFDTISTAMNVEPESAVEDPKIAAKKKALECSERFAVGDPVIKTQDPYTSYEVATPGYMMGDDCFVDLQEKSPTSGNGIGFPQRTPSAQVEPKTWWNSWF